MPTAQDWVRAALDFIGEGGLPAVAVEPIAVRLGATKGSFYWHFPNKTALVDSALAHWEKENTEGVIATVDAEPDPALRLRKLFSAVPSATGGDPVEISLMAAAKNPQVAEVLRRVTERRIDYVAQIFTDLGFPPDEARLRGLLAYTAHLGKVQMIHAVPSALPASVEEQERYRDLMLYMILRRD
ncbi:TetR/AcrR family transcriptional regulator [Spirillospora sp. CA-142024]|uniref:TetR/AcrR family transcriptional regulator n=1 Tax=Spirillospora sp. CA-142024 TaxID=3240036 RepID=UPI003D91EC8E